MKRLLTIGGATAVCLLTIYLLVTSQDSGDFEDDDHDHDHEFLPFSKELVEANHIQVETASPGILKQIVRAPAQIVIISDQKAHVLPKASGIAVIAHKNLGETVYADEVVAVLESREMAEAKASYLTALKKERLAETAFQREKNLHEKNISSAQEFNNAETAKNEAAIELELSRQKLHALGLDARAIRHLPHEPTEKLTVYELRSPIAGKVIARHITPGELVTNDHAIYTIADLSSVWAEIHVFSKDRPYVKEGQTVAITSPEGQSAHASVSYLSPMIDTETRTSTALVKIDNTSETWLPGSFVQATFITEEINVPLLVKKEAIQTIDGVDVLFVSADDGFAVRPVTKGKQDETQCEILSGLVPGEDYACRNTFLLKADLKKEEAEHMD